MIKFNVCFDWVDWYVLVLFVLKIFNFEGMIYLKEIVCDVGVGGVIIGV